MVLILLSKLKYLNSYIDVKFYRFLNCLFLLSLDFQGAKLVYNDTSTVGKHHWGFLENGLGLQHRNNCHVKWAKRKRPGMIQVQMSKCQLRFQFFKILKPGLQDNFFGTVPVWIWPRCLKCARHPHFSRVNGKVRGASAPKHTGAETMWIGSPGPRMSWGTRATNLSIYTTKKESAGPQILGTGATFKSIPCQKNCRVNRA